MQPHTHFLAGLFFGSAVVNYFEVSWLFAILIGVLAVLVDVDHGIAYQLHFKKFSIKGCWNACCYHRFHGGRMFIHHKNGFVVATILILFFLVINPLLSAILASAYYSHYVIDHFTNIETIHEKPFNYKFDISWQEVMLDAIFLVGSIALLFKSPNLL